MEQVHIFLFKAAEFLLLFLRFTIVLIQFSNILKVGLRWIAWKLSETFNRGI